MHLLEILTTPLKKKSGTSTKITLAKLMKSDVGMYNVKNHRESFCCVNGCALLQLYLNSFSRKLTVIAISKDKMLLCISDDTYNIAESSINIFPSLLIYILYATQEEKRFHVFLLNCYSKNARKVICEVISTISAKIIQVNE